VIEHDRDKKENAHTPGPEDPASASVTVRSAAKAGRPAMSSWTSIGARAPAAKPGRRGSRPTGK